MVKKDINELYGVYQTERTPESLKGVVDALEPAINYAVSSIGAGGDKLVRHKARVVAGLAVEKYDPAFGANLNTWVGNQLMQLRRFRRETQQPVKIPERMQLDSMALHKAEQRFMDENDREPDPKELADYAHIPLRRIEKIRRSQRIVPSETLVDAIGGISTGGPDFALEALEYTYDESDKIDKKIIEMKTGFGGKYDPLQPKDIGANLGLTPSQLSRRSARIAYKMQKYQSALEDI